MKFHVGSESLAKSKVSGNGKPGLLARIDWVRAVEALILFVFVLIAIQIVREELASKSDLHCASCSLRSAVDDD